MPGISSGKFAIPCSTVVTVFVPVGPVSVTLAPGTEAPVESTTTVSTLPFTADSCAKLGEAKAISNATGTNHPNHFFNIGQTPFLSSCTFSHRNSWFSRSELLTTDLNETGHTDVVKNPP